jgi:hypothetical protein
VAYELPSVQRSAGCRATSATRCGALSLRWTVPLACATFRKIYEPLFVKWGVSVVFNGHDHSYQRSYPMNNYKKDSCGPVHIVLGNG